jgi:hypothetical protein
MNMVGSGNINLPGMTMDLTLLAAPFTTVDAVVKHIPLIGEILGGTLITIPVRIKGPLSGPEVTTLPISAIGKGLLGMMTRTLTLPFKIIEPIIPKGRQRQGMKNLNKRPSKQSGLFPQGSRYLSEQTLTPSGHYTPSPDTSRRRSHLRNRP